MLINKKNILKEEETNDFEALTCLHSPLIAKAGRFPFSVVDIATEPVGPPAFVTHSYCRARQSKGLQNRDARLVPHGIRFLHTILNGGDHKLLASCNPILFGNICIVPTQQEQLIEPRKKAADFEQRVVLYSGGEGCAGQAKLELGGFVLPITPMLVGIVLVWV